MRAASVHLFKQADGAGSKFRLAGPQLALVQVAQHTGDNSTALHRVLLRRTVLRSSGPFGVTEKDADVSRCVQNPSISQPTALPCTWRSRPCTAASPSVMQSSYLE